MDLAAMAGIAGSSSDEDEPTTPTAELPLFGFCAQRKRQGYYQHYTQEEVTARRKLRAYAFLAVARRKGHDQFDGATGIGRVIIAFAGAFSEAHLRELVRKDFDRLEAQKAALEARLALRLAEQAAPLIERDLAAVETEIQKLRGRLCAERMGLTLDGPEIFSSETSKHLEKCHTPWRILMAKEGFVKDARRAYEANPSAATAKAVRYAEAECEAWLEELWKGEGHRKIFEYQAQHPEDFPNAGLTLGGVLRKYFE